jgi:hypothetical protein
MNATELVRWIGWSHLLQPPLTLLLASPRGLDLRRELVCRSPLAAAVAHNMAVASVALPTLLGVLLALRPEEAFRASTTRDLALLLAAFWSWRFYRQVRALGPNWPRALRPLHGSLLGIFLAQGPLLAALLCWKAPNSALGSRSPGSIQQASATSAVARAPARSVPWRHGAERRRS